MSEELPIPFKLPNNGPAWTWVENKVAINTNATKVFIFHGWGVFQRVPMV